MNVTANTVSSLTACALGVMLGAPGAAATIAYEFRGELTRADFLSDPFLGLEVGDPFAVLLVLDGAAAHDNEEPGRRTWGSDGLRRFEVMFDDRTIVFRAPGGPQKSAEVSVEDDFDAEGVSIRDGFFAVVHQLGIGNASIFYNSLVPFQDGTNDALSGLDFPTLDEFDPSRWDLAQLRLGQPQTILGRIDSVAIVPAPSTLAVLGLAVGLLRRRR